MLNSRYTIQAATHEDAIEMAPHMRRCDVDEIMASHGVRPLDALEHVVEYSDIARVGRADGEIVCMFGVRAFTMLSDKAAIWMLGTDLMDKHSIRFLRENAAELADISKEFVLIENWCDARNTKTLRWLEWLGFKIEDAEPYGLLNLPFHHFYKEIPNVL